MSIDKAPAGRRSAMSLDLRSNPGGLLDQAVERQRRCS